MSNRIRSEQIHIKGSGTGATVAVLASFVPSFAGQFVSVYRMIATVSAAGVLTLQDTSGNALSQPFQLGANGAITLDVPVAQGEPWFTTKDSNNPGAGLQWAQGTGANTVAWDIWYLLHI